MAKSRMFIIAAATSLAVSFGGATLARDVPRGTQMLAALANTTVQGAQVSLEAQWNEAKSGTGRYQAPAGYVIRSATARVRSETRADYTVSVSADRREAVLSVSVRGKGEFWNKERGWFDGDLQIELAPAL